MPQLHAVERPQEWEQSVREINKPSIVLVTVKATRTNKLVDTFTGTGFIVHRGGYVLTCNHVVPAKEPDYVRVEITGSVGDRGEKALPLSIHLRDEQADLALLKFPEQKQPWRSIEASGSGQQGMRIVAIGFPRHQRNLVLEPGAITGTDDDSHRWLTNAATSRGMSGGPVFDQTGAVVAVVSAGHEETQGLNLVTPIGFAKSLLDSIGSPLLLSGPTGLVERAYNIRMAVSQVAAACADIERMMNGGGPLFAAVGSMERQLDVMLKDVPAGKRTEVLLNEAAIRRAATLAWRDPKALALSDAIVDAEKRVASPAMSGDWRIVKIAVDLLSAINADAFSAHTFMVVFSAAMPKGMRSTASPDALGSEELSRRLAEELRSGVGGYWIVKYEQTAGLLTDFLSQFATAAARLSDPAVIEHSSARRAEGKTRTGEMLAILARFEGDFGKDQYEHLVTLVHDLENSMSEEQVQKRFKEFSGQLGEARHLERDQLVRALFLCLKKAGVSDPSLDLFIGVFTNDEKAVAKALADGAAMEATDSELVETYQAIAARECPELYERYEKEKAKPSPPKK